jgi:hypothetical protein
MILDKSKFIVVLILKLEVMNAGFLNNNRLKVKSIQEVNDALVVLKHFIELNSKLLPIYFNLHNKITQSPQDFSKIKKIEATFQSYNFDITSSVLLMNSPILELIQKTFESISCGDENFNAGYHLNRFQIEVDRLRKDWELIMYN